MRFNQSADRALCDHGDGWTLYGLVENTRGLERNMKQQNPVLNPTLQGVLGCLDVQLEAELLRYRRHKAKARSQAANGKTNPLAALDLKALKPLRESISPGFALAQGAPLRHPELDRPGRSVPLPESPVAVPAALDLQDLENSLGLQRFQPGGQDLEIAPNLQDFQTAPHSAAPQNLAPSPVAPAPQVTDPEEYLVPAADSYGAYSATYGDTVAPTFVEPESLPIAADPVNASPSSQREENPYVIMAEPYTPTPVNWASLSIADEPTVLEGPVVEAFDFPIALDGTETVLEPLVFEPLALESLALPAELSETELLALAGSSAAPLGMGSGGHTQADYKIPGYEVSDYEIPDYEISDEDNPWPDELDEEPYALDAAFPEELPVPGSGGEIVEFAIDDEIVPVAIEPDPEALLEPESALSEDEPLLLPAAEHSALRSPLLPAAVLPSYPGPHHLKPVGAARGQMLRPDTESYLASSEALLENLEEEDDRQNWTQRLSNLFTPQGIGSALLLIFSALAVSMVLLNPELVSHWKLGRSGGSTPESGTPTSPEVVIQESPVEGTPANPNPYNLSSQEFLDLDLGNLSKVKPSPGASSPGLTPLSPPSAHGVTPDPTESIASESEMFSDLRESVTGNPDQSPTEESSTAAVSQPSESSRPRSAPAIPEPETLPPPPRQEPSQPSSSTVDSSSDSSGDSSGNSSGNSGSYVVAIPYTSDQLLDQSQAIVPDAYLKNTDQGANIQFGVFSDPEAAAALAEQLQEQGIAVEVLPAEP